MKTTTVWIIHTGYWLLFVLLLLTFYFFAVFVPEHVNTYNHHSNGLQNWMRLMVGFAVLPGATTFYFCYTFLFDRLLSKQRFLPFLLAGVGTAFFTALAGSAIASLPFLYGPNFLFNDGYASALLIICFMAAIAWLNGLMGALIKGCLTWYREIRLKEELHSKNLEAELALLKSQIDPHFLFNTLNNIDILISKDAEAASNYLNKLSAIMRVLLYETKAERISLEREIEYLHQYIELQKIRTSNVDYVEVNVQGMFSGFSIAPMVLLPIIENAFKHTEKRKAESKIAITLYLESNKLTFTCENTLHHQGLATSENSGLGNILIRKRLDLLYPGNYQLENIQHNGIYKVKLNLWL